MRTLSDLSGFLVEYPRTLPVWHELGEEESLLALLSEAELASAQGVREASSEDELWPIGRAWQDAIGVLIRWWADPVRPRYRDRKPAKTEGRRSIIRAIKLALDWPSIESVVVGTHIGLYELRRNQRETAFYFVGDPRHEALAHMMHPPVLPRLDRAGAEMLEIQAWITSREDASPLEMPERIFRAVLRLARHISDQLPREFDPSTQLPRFTLAEAHALWNVIYGYGWVARLITMLTQAPGTALLAPKADFLLADLAQQTGISNETAAAFIEFLSFRPGRHPDPAVSPLVRFHGRLLIPPTLVGMSNFERNLLRLLAYEPQLYGPIGAKRGQEGTKRVANYFMNVDGASVATDVPVLNEIGSPLGDLDVVAVDLAERRGVILEVKWPAEPDSVEETAKAELEIKKGQQQAARLRRAMDEGSGHPRLPHSWGPLDELTWDWFVLCGTHHTSNPALLTQPIRPISWDQLWRVPSQGLEFVVAGLLDEDRLPKEGQDFRLVWDEMRLGGHRVRLQKVKLLDGEVGHAR